MKYKINNYIVDAKSPIDALKAAKKINDTKCKDYYDVKPGAIFKSTRPTFHNQDEYIKVLNVKNNTVSYNLIIKKEGDNQYYTLHEIDKTLDYFKEHLSRRGYKPVSSLYDSNCSDAAPITVEAIPYKNDMYVVLESTWNNHKVYLVVDKKNYHNEKQYTGGGIVEYSLSEAKKTADDFVFSIIAKPNH